MLLLLLLSFLSLSSTSSSFFCFHQHEANYLDDLAKIIGLCLVPELRYPCHRRRSRCCHRCCHCPPPHCHPLDFHHHEADVLDFLDVLTKSMSLSSSRAEITLSSLSSLLLSLSSLLLSSTLSSSSSSSSSSWGDAFDVFDVLAKTPGLYLVPELRYLFHHYRPCWRQCGCPCCPRPPCRHHCPYCHDHRRQRPWCPWPLRENPRSLSSLRAELWTVQWKLW